MYINFTASNRSKSYIKLRICRMMKLTCILLLLAVLQVTAKTYAQKISLKFKDAPLEDVLLNIRQQSGFDFLYSSELLTQANPVTLNLKDASIEEALRLCVAGQPFTYQINQKTVTLTPIKLSKQQNLTVTGRVIDRTNQALPGVSIRVKGAAIGTITDQDGRYRITVPATTSVLVFSYIGYETVERTVNSQQQINVTLVPVVQVPPSPILY